MGWWMLIAAAVTVAQVRAQVTVRPYHYPTCAPPYTTQISAGATAQGLTMPPLPRLPTTFQTRVEANIIDKGLTVVAEEYYDGPNNRAAVRLLQNGTMEYMIFDYKDNQILFVINNQFCYATPLQFDNNNLLFGMKVKSSSMPHIYTTNGALHFAQANGLIWYDYTYKLLRFDYRPAVPAAPFYTTNPVTEIHDYSTGISYAIDRTLGNCTSLPINNGSYGTYINISSTSTGNGKQFYLKMKTPSQLFHLDNTLYTYEGQRVVRGMTCDVFIANRTDFSIYGYTGFTSVFEFYFLSNTWTEINDVGSAVKRSTNIPIQFVITTPSWVGYKAEYNIYNFDPEEPAYNRFDISSCYDDDSKMDFKITFPGPFNDSMVAYKNTFLKKTMERITNVGHVSRLRIQNARFTINHDQAYFTGTLIDVPPPLGTVQNNPFELPLPRAWTLITNNVEVGDFQIAFYVGESVQRFTASSITNNTNCPSGAQIALPPSTTSTATTTTSTTTPGHGAVYPDGWLVFRGSCYLFSDEIQVDWIEGTREKRNENL